MRRIRYRLIRYLCVAGVCAFGQGAASPSALASDRSASGPRELQFVYVAANTGGSSGGHSVLRVGDDVYHYQAESDLLLLLRREPWSYFHRRYRLLDNRGMKLLRLDVSADTRDSIEARLVRLLVVQDTHIDRLQSLECETQWLSSLAGDGPPPSLPGTGLFDPEIRDAPGAARLQRLVAETFGPEFLAREIARLTDALRASAMEVSDPGTVPPAPGQFPVVGEIASERLQERLMLREALRSLSEGRALAADALVVPDGPGLSPRERAQLERFSAHLESAVVRLLRSPRPGRGAPLLLALARCQSVRRSLDAGQWLLLDASPPGAVTVFDEDEVRRHRDLLEALTAQAGEAWAHTRESMPPEETFGEANYARFEESASRYAELRKAVTEGVALRGLGPGPLVPSREGRVAAPEMQVDPVLLENARALSRQHRDWYAKAVRRIYGYDLIRHNCTTELLRAIRSAFPDEAAAIAALGGAIDPAEGGDFIPGEVYRRIQERWAVTGHLELPSHRKGKVASLAAAAPRDFVRLRESNTLTATVYPGSVDDDAFLFFADGKRVLRPFQGIANLGYGLAHSAAGAVALPADGGRRTWAGLRGVFYSFPELVGISIRKGRYDILPADTQEDLAAESDNAVVSLTPQDR